MTELKLLINAEYILDQKEVVLEKLPVGADTGEAAGAGEFGAGDGGEGDTGEAGGVGVVGGSSGGTD
jgi:hypothetical protein